MAIAEPTTLATDYALGTLSEIFGILLLRHNRTLRQSCISSWAIALMAAAMSSYLGGTYHGFQHMLGAEAGALLWKLTAIAMGVASFFLLTAGFTATFSAPIRVWLIAAAAVKLVGYSVWMLYRDEFRFVIYDYGSTLLILFALTVSGWTSGTAGHRRYITAGILVSIAAALLQQSGFQLHRHFNHNDLMHVVQMGGVWLLFKGGARLRDRTTA